MFRIVFWVLGTGQDRPWGWSSRVEIENRCTENTFVFKFQILISHEANTQGAVRESENLPEMAGRGGLSAEVTLELSCVG